MEMYNLNGKFNTFYNNHVVLKKTQKNELHEKKKLNIDRLKNGLIAYNKDNSTDYKMAEEPVTQGSVAMHTVTQNESNDYDIDVAIVFEKDNFPISTTIAKRVIEKALLKTCTGFKIAPKAHTNCVRVVYQDGYHIDFAIYRRFKEEESDDEYKYEHCGSQWRERNPRAITKWFMDQNKIHDSRLREIVRLLKMFSKSKAHWEMPGGLIQSVLADEQCQSSYTRLDERFYYTLKQIKNRLETNKEVLNPTDPTQSLVVVQSDSAKITNLSNRLTSYLTKLDVLFDSACTENEAISAWNDFFNHSYWDDLQENRSLNKMAKSYSTTSEYFYDFRETEEFIEYVAAINLKNTLLLDCNIVKGGNRIGKLSDILKNNETLDGGLSLYFTASTNALPPYKVYWKVKNRGEVAKKMDDIRGELITGMVKENELFHYEETQFDGDHFVECYIVKKGICVAKGRINVPIKVK